MSSTQSSYASARPQPGFRHKTVAGLLAFLLGWAGAHWWYVGRRHGWLPLAFTAAVLVTAWLRPAPLPAQLLYYLVLVPVVAGFVEALIFCLMSDARFDARYNAGQSRRSANGWAPVLLAMAVLLIGMAVIMGHVVMASLEMVNGTLGF